MAQSGDGLRPKYGNDKSKRPVSAAARNAETKALPVSAKPKPKIDGHFITPQCADPKFNKRFESFCVSQNTDNWVSERHVRAAVHAAEIAATGGTPAEIQAAQRELDASKAAERGDLAPEIAAAYRGNERLAHATPVTRVAVVEHKIPQSPLLRGGGLRAAQPSAPVVRMASAVSRPPVRAVLATSVESDFDKAFKKTGLPDRKPNAGNASPSGRGTVLVHASSDTKRQRKPVMPTNLLPI